MLHLGLTSASLKILKKQITEAPSELRMLKLSMLKKLKMIKSVEQTENAETVSVEEAQEEDDSIAKQT